MRGLDLPKLISRLHAPIFIVTALSTICHAVALSQFHYYYAGSDIFQAWGTSFHVLLLISLGITFLLPFLVGRFAPLFWIFIRMVLFIIIGVPLGDNVGIEFTLVTILILEISLHINYPINLFVSFVLIGVFLYFQQSIIAWGNPRPSASSANLLFFAFFSSILTILSSFQVLTIRRMQQQEKENEELNDVIAKLTTANSQFQDYSYRIMEESTLSERNRISRELHDTIGYCLTNVNMMMEAAQSLSPKKDTKLIELLKQVQREARDGLKDTRKALYLLRAKTIQMPQGLKSIIRLCETFQMATGVVVNVKTGNTPWHFGEKIDLVIFRIVQEGMTNALSHGKADQIDVILRRESSWINVFVRDNGMGVEDIEHLKKGIGLTGMQERLEELGGHLEMMNQTTGFAVSAWIPYEDIPSDEANS